MNCGIYCSDENEVLKKYFERVNFITNIYHIFYFHLLQFLDTVVEPYY